MSKFTVTVTVSATGEDLALARALAAVLQVAVERLLSRMEKFLARGITPQSMYAFEVGLWEIGRELLRGFLECVLQHIEPADPDKVAARIRTSFVDEYRRRPKSKLSLGTLFGVVTVYRFLYEPLLPGESCLFPLDLWIGVEAGHVSPALGEKIARLAAEHSQGDVIKIVNSEHGVKLSVERLRTIIAGVSERISPFVKEARVQRLTQLLKAAFAGQGRFRPSLGVGRDGCDIPIRGTGYKVASTATVSVFDRRGKRLGTVYLGYMPQENQLSLTAELTELLQAVFEAWTGPMPRLVYITDSGYQESHYWSVLRKMRHPVTGERLAWIRIADFYHVCQYVNRLGIALFGEGRESQRWFAKMRRLLRDEPRGAQRVLSSAAALRVTRGPVRGKPQKEFQDCYRYLSKRLRFLDYHDYRRRGLPIGSGVTEAACKIVFTQRFKRSGMTWKCESGQHVLTLRTLTLSGLWQHVFHASLAAPSPSTVMLQQRANGPMTHVVLQNAA
jgi:hypothetical protein